VPDHARATAPTVFLSFSGTDRGVAEKLADDLREYGIDARLDRQVEPGSNWVLWINDALTQSDYYVLLWSAATRDRPWVDEEWSNALIRQLSGRRSFLFIIRLDDSPLPVMLAARQCLDAAHRPWGEVVSDLVSAWGRGTATGAPALPAPRVTTGQAIAPTVLITVRNRALSFAIVLAVPETVVAADLIGLVRARLDLPDEQVGFGGRVGVRFRYQLVVDGGPLPATSADALRLTDGCVVELEVSVEPFGPDGALARPTGYRGPGGISPAAVRHLVRTAFRHLIP